MWLVTRYPEARALLADPRLSKDGGMRLRNRGPSSASVPGGNSCSKIHR